MTVTENILKYNKDYLKLLRMNETDDPIVKKTIENVSALVNEISAFKSNLNDIIFDYEARDK